MKLISTISLLLINFCQTSGQTIREFENELRKRPITLSAVQDVIDRFKKNKEGVVFLKQRHRISYFELLYSKFLIRDTTTEYNSWISLITYSKNDLIFSFLLEAQTNFTEGISYQDSAIAKKNIEEFNTNNTTDYKWQDQFRETGFDIFGITWGLPIYPMDSIKRLTLFDDYIAMSEIFKKVSRTDTARLVRDTRSKCSETKAYGIAGLYLLKESGFPLSKDHELLLTLHLESREYIAFAPGGCTISTVEMRDAFSDKLFIKDLKDSYSLFLTNFK